jgi:chromosomal replication initiation ATPase DnaA
MTRTVDIGSVVETYEFALAELGSKREAMAVAMRAYSMSATGLVERTPRELVFDVVCSYYRVTMGEVLGRSRRHPLPSARRAIMYLLKAGGYSNRECADAVGRKQPNETVGACHSVDGNASTANEVAGLAKLIADRLPVPTRRLAIYPGSRSR